MEGKNMEKTKLETLKNLQEHIKNYPLYNDYCKLDIALAHRLGGAKWEENENKLKAILCNLDRLLEEKGPRPSEKDLRDYIEAHCFDILYIPGTTEKLISILISLKFVLSMDKKE